MTRTHQRWRVIVVVALRSVPEASLLSRLGVWHLAPSAAAERRWESRGVSPASVGSLHLSLPAISLRPWRSSKPASEDVVARGPFVVNPPATGTCRREGGERVKPSTDAERRSLRAALCYRCVLMRGVPMWPPAFHHACVLLREYKLRNLERKPGQLCRPCLLRALSLVWPLSRQPTKKGQNSHAENVCGPRLYGAG